MKTTATSLEEVRTFVVSEIRATDADGKPKVSGHAAVFNSMSEDLGGFREIIAPGCFTETVSEDDIRALWNHDTNIVLGRNKSGTLELFEDERGLGFNLMPPDTQLVKDMCLSPISRGDVSQCSFRFRTISDKWEIRDGEHIRTVLKARVSEISPVTFPAYGSTEVALRSKDAAMKDITPANDWQNEIRKKRLALAS